MRMLEEVNRLLIDRVSMPLFCSPRTAASDLQEQGTGEAILFYGEMAGERNHIPQQVGSRRKDYALATCHREENTDDPEGRRCLLIALGQLAAELPVLLPLHPRTSPPRGAPASASAKRAGGDAKPGCAQQAQLLSSLPRELEPHAHRGHRGKQL